MAHFRPAIALVAIALLCTACMSSPRNGQHYTDRRDEIVFTGRIMSPGSRVDVSIRNRMTGAWEPYQSFWSGSAPWTDGAGVTWYEWGGAARLPAGDQYWTMIAGTPADAYSHMRMHFRAVWDGRELDTFDVSADPCVRDHYSEGVFSVIEHCHSASTPVASVTAGCGSPGLGCCLYGICGPDATCNLEGECASTRPPSSYAALADYPRSGDFNWGHHPQGVAIDDTHWYVVVDNGDGDAQWIGFAPVGEDLNRDFTARINPPALHGRHLGDPEVFRGRIYIPLEQGGQPIAVASMATSEILTMGNAAPVRIAHLPPDRGHAAWVAINPINGHLYTSAGYMEVDTVDEFEIRDDASGFALPFVRRINLSGVATGLPLREVQGGAFGPDGTLYLLSSENVVSRGGVHTFRSDGTFLQRIHVVYNDTWDTMEGITVRDLDDGRAPGIAGDVHVLQFEAPSMNVFFHHYRANP
jgi:hypothetical protein